MRRAVPAERLPLLLSLVSVWEATMDKAGVAAADIKSFSVSAEVMAPGLERTVLVWSSWVLVTVSSVTAVWVTCVGEGGGGEGSLTTLGTW